MTRTNASSARPSHRVLLRLGPRALPEWLDTVHHTRWLSAPMGGYPWVRRVLEALLPLRPSALAVASSIGASALGRLLEESGTFGFPLLSEEQYLSTPLGPMERLAVYEFSGSSLGLSDVQHRELASKVQSGPVLVDGGSTNLLLLPAGWNPNHATATEFLLASSAEWRLRVAAPRVLALEPRPTCGSAYDLRQATQRFLDGGCMARLLNGRVLRGALLSPGAQIHPSAVVSGPVAIGPMSYVGPEVTLLPGAVVGARCFLGEGAVIRDAVVLDGTRIEPGFCTEASVRSGDQVFLGGSPPRNVGGRRDSRADPTASLIEGERTR